MDGRPVPINLEFCSNLICCGSPDLPASSPDSCPRGYGFTTARLELPPGIGLTGRTFRELAELEAECKRSLPPPTLPTNYVPRVVRRTPRLRRRGGWKYGPPEIES